MFLHQIFEGLRDPKDNPCWNGYKPVGTKQKNGKTVPNCVPKKQKAKIDEVSLGDYHKKATMNRALSQMSAAFGNPDDKEKHLATAAKRERGLARSQTRADKRAAEQEVKRNQEYEAEIRAKYAGIDIDAEIAKLKPAIERAYNDYQYGARNTYSQARDEYNRLKAKYNQLNQAKEIIQVKEQIKPPTDTAAGAYTRSKTAPWRPGMKEGVAEGLPNQEEISLRGKPVNINSIEIDGVDRRDHPDYADAYISYAEYADGTELNDEELELLTDQYGDVVNLMANDSFSDYASDAYDRWKDRDLEEGMWDRVKTGIKNALADNPDSEHDAYHMASGALTGMAFGHGAGHAVADATQKSQNQPSQNTRVKEDDPDVPKHKLNHHDKIAGRYDPDEFDQMVMRLGQKAKEQERKHGPVDLAKLAQRLRDIK